LKEVHHIIASSAETIGAFNTGFDTANLHRPATAAAARTVKNRDAWLQGLMDSARHVIGCHSTQGMRVYKAFDEVASTIHQSPPRH